MRYEYKVVPRNMESRTSTHSWVELEDLLNYYAEHGWRLNFLQRLNPNQELMILERKKLNGQSRTG